VNCAGASDDLSVTMLGANVGAFGFVVRDARAEAGVVRGDAQLFVVPEEGTPSAEATGKVQHALLGASRNAAAFWVSDTGLSFWHRTGAGMWDKQAVVAPDDAVLLASVTSADGSAHALASASDGVRRLDEGPPGGDVIATSLRARGAHAGALALDGAGAIRGFLLDDAVEEYGGATLVPGIPHPPGTVDAQARLSATINQDSPWLLLDSDTGLISFDPLRSTLWQSKVPHVTPPANTCTGQYTAQYPEICPQDTTDQKLGTEAVLGQHALVTANGRQLAVYATQELMRTCSWSAVGGCFETLPCNCTQTGADWKTVSITITDAASKTVSWELPGMLSGIALRADASGERVFVAVLASAGGRTDGWYFLLDASALFG
jgi:hypothetical protein